MWTQPFASQAACQKVCRCADSDRHWWTQIPSFDSQFQIFHSSCLQYTHQDWQVLFRQYSFFRVIFILKYLHILSVIKLWIFTLFFFSSLWAQSENSLEMKWYDSDQNISWDTSKSFNISWVLEVLFIHTKMCVCVAAVYTPFKLLSIGVASR